MSSNNSNSSFLASEATLYSTSTDSQRAVASANNLSFLYFLMEAAVTIPD